MSALPLQSLLPSGSLRAARTQIESSATAANVRQFTVADIPSVAALFHRTFRSPNAPPPDALAPYLKELFFEHPWQNADISSLVYVRDDGRLVGFVGVLPANLRWRGDAVLAAVAVALMVEDPQRDPTAGARLVRSVLGGPQQLTISESANPLSRRMWELMGSRSFPIYSMDWLRILRPASFPLSMIAHRFGGPRVLPRLTAPLDNLMNATGRNPLAPLPANPRYIGSDADDDTICEAIPELLAPYTLHPQWDRDSLPWFLRHAAVKEHYGTLAKRVVCSPAGRLVGAYLYYPRRHSLGYVLHVLALPDHADAVLRDLFAHACANKIVALKGRAQPEFADALLRNRCVFWNGGSTIVHTKNPALIDDIRSGTAAITGLAAEAWTRLIGGRFA